MIDKGKDDEEEQEVIDKGMRKDDEEEQEVID